MDLKSILSPSNPDEKLRPSKSSPTTPAASSQTPRDYVHRSSSNTSIPARATTYAASPLSQQMLPSGIPAHVISPHHQPTSSPLITPVPATPGTPHAQRGSSTPSMDTLADLASMQSHQPTRPAPLKATSLDSIKSADSASRFSSAQAALTSNPRASFDINMLDAPKDTRRTDFTNTSLAPEQQVRAAELATYLAENPSAYESHVALISILHQAFISHVYPTSATGEILPKRDPASFELLNDLRNARAVMEKTFAIGESQWLDWLQDESMLARNTEERIDAIEKFRKAVSEEALSTKLWAAYGDWVLECYRWAVTGGGTVDVDEDKLVGREVFTWQMVLETWQDAVDSTAQDIALSHVVWNKYIELRISEFENGLSKEQATTILGLFEKRLRVPHIASDTTRQVLSNFMNTHFSQEQYFEIMEDTSRVMKDALKALGDRSSWEARLEETLAKNDRDAEYNTFAQYIEWEKTPAKGKRLNIDMCNALYQRAELRFPADATLWEDHVEFLLENAGAALDLLSRATKHCPWSGSLWSQYLLTSDRQGQSYEDTENVKHKATSTGVLEAAGIEEVLKVHAAWCSYLRRRAVRSDHDEDDEDIAEIGIRASLESISSLGAKMGIGESPDPSFRIQRIYINFLSESGRWDHAQREFDNAVRDYGNSWQFWMRFYHWEMMRWRQFSIQDKKNEPLARISVPHLATAVLKQALDQASLDYPEPIAEALISHCEDFEDAEELQRCLLKVRRLERILSARRQIEALQNAQAGAVNQIADQVPDGSTQPLSPQTKRKRGFSDSDETLHESYKKSKTDEDAVETIEQTQPKSPKRDREHATVLVENLPENVAESKVRQYFSNCGTVKALKMLDGGGSALIEFDDNQSAHYALSRNGQQFEDAVISVVLDTGSTVFLTNYALEMGEQEIRQLLEPYGDIISIRLPSLQGNKRRRFCYAQFKLPGEAQNAVNSLDKQDIGGLALVCKISNPAMKKSRQEMSANDGRTVFIGGLNFKATEDEVTKHFDHYGKISLVRIPRDEKMKTRNKGIAFVTYTSPEEAKAALGMNGQQIKGREVKVTIATDNRSRNSRQPSATPSQLNSKGVKRSATPATTQGYSEPRSERTVFLTNLPDTVNEARLRHVASKHSEVVKCILKTNHQGALVEYATVALAGEAALALHGYEIVTGRRIEVVSEEEMKTRKPEKKSDGFLPRTNAEPAAPAPASGGFIRRPTQPGSRARKGGNLGQRSAMLHSSNISHQPEKDPELQSNGTVQVDAVDTKKSNADFRALLSAGSKQGD